MNGLAQRMAKARKDLKMTQSEAAERLGVSFQAVSQWERGETSPDIHKLPEIAALYGVSIDWMLTGTSTRPVYAEFAEPLSDRLFDENRMYTYIKTCASIKQMHQTLKVLPYVREQHTGQVRKGREAVPYVYHPLLMACHALALNLDDDRLVSAVLLHDVCEDCGITPDELPVDEEVKEAVRLVTKKDSPYTDEEKQEYYSEIAKNPIALMVKLLDRCCNVSGMAAGFSREKLVDYINETEKWFYPMLQQGKTDYPQYNNQIFVLRYHISSVISSLKHMMHTETCER